MNYFQNIHESTEKYNAKKRQEKEAIVQVFLPTAMIMNKD